MLWSALISPRRWPISLEGQRVLIGCQRRRQLVLISIDGADVVESIGLLLALAHFFGEGQRRLEELQSRLQLALIMVDNADNVEGILSSPRG